MLRRRGVGFVLSPFSRIGLDSRQLSESTLKKNRPKNSARRVSDGAALAGAGTAVLTGLIARELGGTRFAQGVAALCLLLAPGVLALDYFLSMNAFEPLFWMGCAYLVIRTIRTGNAKLWPWFGLVAGVGLEN